MLPRFIIGFVIVIGTVMGMPVYAQSSGLNLDGLEEVVSIGEQPAAPAAMTQTPQANALLNPPAAESTAEETTASPKMTVWGLLKASGTIGFIIMLLSLVSVALMIEYAMSLRRTVLMPPGFADEVLKMLTQGQAASAMKKCQNDSSALAQIIYAGMTQYEFGWNAVEKSAEEATAEQASRLYRKVEYLNMIGNIAPMLGLLGTVVGMVIAFQQMAESGGYGRASELAQGIYLALVTTIQGLVVAIPCLAAHSLFSSKIATLISETTFAAEQVLQPIKKSLMRNKQIIAKT